MKNITYLILTIVATFIIGCSDNIENNIITSQQLSQTIWDGSTTSYDSANNPGVTTSFILEFISNTEGKCVLQDLNEIQRFQYSVKESIISFNGSYAVSGDWYLIESSKDQLILQSYRPAKMIMTLSRIY